MSDVGCEANRRWRKEEFLLMFIFSSCWIRHISNVDYYINRWSWTDFIVDVEKKCWTADWLLMLVVILIRWILHHSSYHRLVFLSRLAIHAGVTRDANLDDWTNFDVLKSYLAARLGRIKQKKSSWGLAMNSTFLLFVLFPQDSKLSTNISRSLWMDISISKLLC